MLYAFGVNSLSLKIIENSDGNPTALLSLISSLVEIPHPNSQRNEQNHKW